MHKTDRTSAEAPVSARAPATALPGTATGLASDPARGAHPDAGLLPGGTLVRRGGRICVFRALPGIGDLLCAVPALRAIRAARPDVVVTLVTLPAALELAGRFAAYVDEVVAFPGFPGLPDREPDVAALPGFLASMQARRFDLAIQLHGIGDRTNDIVRLFGARSTAGFHPPADPAPEAGQYLPWRADETEVGRWLRLVGHLGWPSEDVALEIPFDRRAGRDLDRLLAEHHPATALGRRIAVVHPGASVPERRWSAGGFAEVVDRLVAHGETVVLTGVEAERALTARVRATAADPGRVIDLAGRTTIDTLAALVARADVVVANDTGISHIADALGIPSVVVFTGSDLERWAPLDRTLHHPLTGTSAGRVADEAVRMLRVHTAHAA